MTLIELKSYLQSVNEVSLLDLCRRSKTGPDIMRDMLSILMRKGKVCLKQRTNACGQTCNQCDPLFIEMYCWVS